MNKRLFAIAAHGECIKMKETAAGEGQSLGFLYFRRPKCGVDSATQLTMLKKVFVDSIGGWVHRSSELSSSIETPSCSL